MVFSKKEKQLQIIENLYFKYKTELVQQLYEDTTHFETAIKNPLYLEYLKVLLISDKIHSYYYMNLLTFNTLVGEHLEMHEFFDKSKGKK